MAARTANPAPGPAPGPGRGSGPATRRTVDYATPWSFAPALPALGRPAGRRSPWLTAAGLVLLAYALAGKGAGYIGYPPVFIGELLLLGGVGSLVVFGRFRGVRLPPMLGWVAALASWGLIRTVPYVGTYGVDALRDAVIWGYAAFAFIIFLYIRQEPARFARVLRDYRRFAAIAVVGMPLLWMVRFVLGENTPHWPWADTTVLEPKPGDIMVHLGGILAFWVGQPGKPVRGWQLALFGLSAGVLGAYERAAMFAFGCAFLLCAWYRPGHALLKSLAMMGLAGLAALAVSGAKFEVPVADSIKVREISFEQFAQNVVSAVLPSNMGDLDETKEWRLNWWREILKYTLHGRYFWAGKGFGVNLADDDGFQVLDDHSLRSPHNAHLMLLARAGVVGLGLWLAVQLGWAWAMRRALVRCLREGDARWAGVFLFLLAYWIGFMINCSFDVFLEGPMGGVWFWTVYGLGLSALWVREHHPRLLEEEEVASR